MARSTVTVVGLTDVARALRALPTKLSGAGGGPVRGALFAATKVIRDAARANAPVGVGTPMPGNLRRQIYAYRDRNPKATGATERYTISVRKRKKNRKPSASAYGQASARQQINVIGGDAYYWHFVEFGTVNQPPQAFLRRAFEENKALAVGVFTVEIKAGIERAVLKLSKRSPLR